MPMRSDACKCGRPFSNYCFQFCQLFHLYTILPFSPIHLMSRVVWISLHKCSHVRKNCLCFWEMIGTAKTVLWKGARMQDGGVAEVMYVLIEAGCFLESSSL